jgi:hypothetical protein
MKSRYTEQEDQIITSVADMYSSTGKGLNKAKRALRKKFSITVSEGELRRRLEALKKNRERHT